MKYGVGSYLTNLRIKADKNKNYLQKISNGPKYADALNSDKMQISELQTPIFCILRVFQWLFAEAKAEIFDDFADGVVVGLPLDYDYPATKVCLYLRHAGKFR